jgi:hypothetical protein
MTAARLLLLAVLVLGSGCARPDWIEQTLVTTDVTGTWQTGEGLILVMRLEQHWPKVTGVMRGGTTWSGAIEGTVSGDVFKFTQTSGAIVVDRGEMTVNGDEMTGRLYGRLPARTEYTFRRADPARPISR